MRPFEACPFCNGEFMFDWINDTRRCNNCGALFTWRIIREPSGVPIDLTLQLKKAEDRIAELKAENDELKERVAMLDVNSVYKSLSEMGYIGQVANLEAENAALQARIAELEEYKERLKSCESALVSMVYQFFYSKDGESIFRHSFMSAEEEAANYLVEHGIARWVGENKSAIFFNEVVEEVQE